MNNTIINKKQINEMIIQYQKAKNIIDFLEEQFEKIGIDPNLYLYKREKHAKSPPNDFRKRLDMLRRRN